MTNEAFSMVVVDALAGQTGSAAALGALGSHAVAALPILRDKLNAYSEGLAVACAKIAKEALSSSDSATRLEGRRTVDAILEVLNRTMLQAEAEAATEGTFPYPFALIVALGELGPLASAAAIEIVKLNGMTWRTRYLLRRKPAAGELVLSYLPDEAVLGLGAIGTAALALAGVPGFLTSESRVMGAGGVAAAEALRRINEEHGLRIRLRDSKWQVFRADDGPPGPRPVVAPARIASR